MDKIVLEEQSGFVKGHSIANSLMIASEIVRSVQKSYSNGLVIKLDFAKAFDSVKWSLIFHHRLYEVPSLWVDWIKQF